MNKCELCDSPANMYCDSDQASLCWNCDSQVHGANFLVAKHSRTLLCHVCQSFTPWNGSGPKLGPTISVCESCVNSNSQNDAANDGNDLDNEHGGGDDPHRETNIEEDDDDGDDDDDDDDDDEDDDDGHRDEDQGGIDEDDEENQVVPLSSTPPPPASSSETRRGIP